MKKRLRLKKVVIRDLDDAALAKIAGGIVPVTAQANCPTVVGCGGPIPTSNTCAKTCSTCGCILTNDNCPVSDINTCAGVCTSGDCEPTSGCDTDDC
jgi:hypothetical protein